MRHGHLRPKLGWKSEDTGRQVQHAERGIDLVDWGVSYREWEREVDGALLRLIMYISRLGW